MRLPTLTVAVPNAYIYIDGSAAGTMIGFTIDTPSGTTFYLGTDMVSAGFLVGTISNVAVWDTDIGDPAAVAISSGTSPTSYPANLIHFWPLSGGDLTDHVGTLSLTPVGAPAVGVSIGNNSGPSAYFNRDGSLKLADYSTIVVPVEGMIAWNYATHALTTYDGSSWT